MLDERIKVPWHLPLMAFFVPGLCYAVTAFVPVYSPPFAVIGIALTLLAFIVLIIRVITPKSTKSLRYRIIASQSFALVNLAFAIRMWRLSFPGHDAVFVLVSAVLYVLSWLGPYLAPEAITAVYREIWHPKTPVVRTLAWIFTAIGGSAGYVGGSIGQDLSETFGDGVWTILALLVTLTMIGGNLYLSNQIWRRYKGLPDIPPR